LQIGDTRIRSGPDTVKIERARESWRKVWWHCLLAISPMYFGQSSSRRCEGPRHCISKEDSKDWHPLMLATKADREKPQHRQPLTPSAARPAVAGGLLLSSVSTAS